MFVNLGRAGRSVRASMQEKDIPSCIGSSADYWMEYHLDGIRCLEWEWQSSVAKSRRNRTDRLLFRRLTFIDVSDKGKHLCREFCISRSNTWVARAHAHSVRDGSKVTLPLQGACHLDLYAHAYINSCGSKVVDFHVVVR